VETIALIKTRTRQFAKRQMTWLRRQLKATWIDVDAAAPMAQVAVRVQGLLQ
jgi:tRNA A37 N6-isopentenylltransferase MiaA